MQRLELLVSLLFLSCWAFSGVLGLLLLARGRREFPCALWAWAAGLLILPPWTLALYLASVRRRRDLALAAFTLLFALPMALSRWTSARRSSHTENLIVGREVLGPGLPAGDPVSIK
ncbi:MAG: hypothetical protein WC969_04465 [Elusimicrobiota bacterium]|jgi:hypothetical protein